MFDAVRNNKRIVQVFLALITLPFAFFGVESYVRSVGTGDDVASVGDVKITQQQFQQALREQQERLRTQLGGQFDPKLLDTPQARQMILDDLVDQQLLLIETGKRKMFASDEAIRAAIGGIEAFKVDGKFSAERYDALLKAQGMTPASFEARLRQDLTLQQLAGGIGQSGLMARTVSDRILAMQTEKREVQEYRIGIESFLDKVKLEDGAAKKFYDENSRQFEIPERAKVEFVVLSMETIGAQLTVSDAEIKAWFDGHKDRFQQPEERRASHILIGSEKIGKDKARARAEQLLKEIQKNPAAFAELAKKNSDDPGSAVKGGDLGFFGRGAMVKAFEDAVFAAKKDEIVGPVRSDFGFHVIRLTAEKPAKGKTLAEATPEIEAELKKGAASRRFAEVAECLSNMVYEQPTSLKPVTDAYKLPVQQSGWFSRAGGAPPALAHPKVLAEIFSDNAIKAKRNTAAVEGVAGTVVAARVIEHKPAEQRPLEAVRAVVEMRAKREEALKLATAEGEAALKEYQAGKDAGLKWPAPLAVSRPKPGGLPPPVLDKIFKVDAKALPGYAGAQSPAGFAVVKVSKVIEIGEIDDAKRKSLSAQLQQAVALGELESSVGSLRESVGVQLRKETGDKKADASAK